MPRNISWISEARFQPYLKQAGGFKEKAWDLYEWNAAISAALFEVVHHVEVLIRNAMMRELEKVHPMSFPWNRPNMDNIASVAARLTDRKTQKAPDKNDIISQLNLGFWTDLVYPSDFQKSALWNSHLHRAFPGQRDSQIVGLALEDLRQLRNRCSHQDSLLTIDPAIEMKKIERLIAWIDPAAVGWISSLSRVEDVLKKRPNVPNEPDTLIVASTRNRSVVKSGKGSFRYPLYDCYRSKHGIILEDSVRIGREVTYLGFYLPKEDPHSTSVSTYASSEPKAHIARELPLIEERYIPQEWSKEHAKKLESGDERSRKIGKLMKHGLGNGYTADKNYVIYLLSDPAAPETISNPVEIVHNEAGQGSAFVKLTRYLRIDALRGARQTSDLR